MTLIKFISTEETLAIRNEVLRNGELREEECRFVGDDDEGSFHLGLFVHCKLVVIVTFHKRNHPDFVGKGYQLRGMAALKEYRGEGYGLKLINFATVYLRRQKADYIWCNARKVAYSFYTHSGFEFISEEYEIADIGPHKTMYLKIQ